MPSCTGVVTMAFPNRAKQCPAWSGDGRFPLAISQQNGPYSWMATTWLNGWKSPCPSIEKTGCLGFQVKVYYIGFFCDEIDEIHEMMFRLFQGRQLNCAKIFRFHLRIWCFQLAVEESTVKSSSIDIRPNSTCDISSRNLNYLVVEPTHLKNKLLQLDHFPRVRGET